MINKKVKIMKYETIQSTLIFTIQYSLIVALCIHMIVTSPLIGFVLTTLILTNTKIRYPQITYESDLE